MAETMIIDTPYSAQDSAADSSAEAVSIETRLGSRTIDQSKIIYFPRGLAGFEDLHEFILLQIQQGSPMLILQSMDEPGLGLLVADPYSFIESYQVKVGDPEQRLLRLKKPQQVAVLVTVSIPHGKPELTALNLTGPILINYASKIGLQIPQTVDPDKPAQVYIHQNSSR